MTTTTNQPDRSSAPGILPEPAHVSDDAAPLTAAAGKRDPAPERRNPVREAAVAKVMSALRGDKYMVDPYPAAESEDSAASDNAGSRARER
jgi:hypothetical protein